MIDKISTTLRTYILLGVDILTCANSFVISFLLIYSIDHFSTFFTPPILTLFFSITALRLLFFYKFGLYNFLWRYASTKAFVNVIKASSFSALIILITHLFTPEILSISTRLLIIDIVLNFLFIGGSRVFLRLVRDYLRARLLDSNLDLVKESRIIIVGAGDAGEMICREIRRQPELGYKIVGFVDDKANKIGQFIHQLPILGAIQDLPTLIQAHHIQEVLIAMPTAPGHVIKNIFSICENTQIKFKTTPKFSDIIDGKVRADQIRKVRLEDLLQRNENKLDLDGISNYLSSNVIMVTGAGGSIGSELCRQIIQFSPKTLILLDHNENAIYDLNMQLSNLLNTSTTIVPYVTDIKNKDRLALIFDTHRPDIVFHAAAHKHVPLMEFNVIDVIQNNIKGTYNLISLADQFEVSKFIFISTDKAVHPKSCMGASKRIGEVLIQRYAATSNTRFSAVRFGNVLGSQGSVIPLFKKQIQNGGPITITHPDMKRYFMTIQEAVRLVLQTGAFSEGGEIFILDMGEPVKIIDLARTLIRLSGLKEGVDINIVISGIRPGEKLFETLYFNPKKLNKTSHDKIFISQPQTFDSDLLLAQIHTLISNTLTDAPSTLKEALFTLCQHTLTDNAITEPKKEFSHS